jgi:hypothetical protein
VKRLTTILLIILLGSALGAAGGKGKGKANHGPRQARSRDGDYNARVAGYYCGRGNAVVDDRSVSLSLTIRAEDGTSGPLIASGLTIDGPYFSGSGTAFGYPIYIHGRLDAARASRLVATFTSDDGHSAQIVGTLPATVDKGDDSWDDSN